MGGENGMKIHAQYSSQISINYISLYDSPVPVLAVLKGLHWYYHPYIY